MVEHTKTLQCISTHFPLTASGKESSLVQYSSRREHRNENAFITGFGVSHRGMQSITMVKNINVRAIWIPLFTDTIRYCDSLPIPIPTDTDTEMLLWLSYTVAIKFIIAEAIG